MVLPASFLSSYQEFENYPTQLIHHSAYAYALDKCKTRLREEDTRGLCIKDDVKTLVCFRDLDPSYSAPVVKTITSDGKLQAWLEYQADLDSQTQIALSTITKKDPRCRFIFFSGGTSRDPLKVSLTSLTRTLTYHQVMSSYLDFIYVFGKQKKSRDLGHTGFREQTLLSDRPLQGPAISDLGRSGRQFQISYNLKAPYFREKPGKIWTIRQVAIHHQFDIIEGTSLWIITKGDHKDLKKYIEDLTGPNGRREDYDFTTPATCFASSLAVHTLLAHWASEDWRVRIRALEDDVDEATYDAIDATRAPGHECRVYVPDDLTSLQALADKINEVIMVMEANVNILLALKTYYTTLLEHKDFPFKSKCEGSVAVFAAQLTELSYDITLQISRAKALAQLTAERKVVIIQHLQSQATESQAKATVTMENLTRSMFKVGILSQSEAAAMRVITVLTLLYLPATFVSTFFSTDVVQYGNNNNNNNNNSNSNSALSNQDSGNSTSFSNIALERWLEVTLPLTFVTIVLAIYLYRKSVKALAAAAKLEIPYYEEKTIT